MFCLYTDQFSTQLAENYITPESFEQRFSGERRRKNAISITMFSLFLDHLPIPQRSRLFSVPFNYKPRNRAQSHVLLNAHHQQSCVLFLQKLILKFQVIQKKQLALIYSDDSIITIVCIPQRSRHFSVPFNYKPCNRAAQCSSPVELRALLAKNLIVKFQASQQKSCGVSSP